MIRRRRRSIELAAIEPNERVLLLGAGTGLDLELLPLGANITAIDITPAMIGRLLARAARLGLTVDARVMDGQALDFPSESFDVVVLHAIVAVIPDPVRCMKEAARVLRLGGRAVIYDKFVPDESELPLLLRVLNPLTALVATEVTRKLGPILAQTPLRIIHQESAGMGGFIKIVLARKD
jgi:phosphatidylethanolamine/phosphatidyl-N-methylethanolamine N-methyltransferase